MRATRTIEASSTCRVIQIGMNGMTVHEEALLAGGRRSLSMMTVMKNDNFDFYDKLKRFKSSVRILIEYKCCLDMHFYFEMTWKSDDSIVKQI